MFMHKWKPKQYASNNAFMFIYDRYQAKQHFIETKSSITDACITPSQFLFYVNALNKLTRHHLSPKLFACTTGIHERSV